MEAQRFPADYSGIAVGDPVNYFTPSKILLHWWPEPLDPIGI
jgi:hypothetical protein